MKALEFRVWMAAASAVALAGPLGFVDRITAAQASSPMEAGKQGPRHFKVSEPATKDDAVALLQTSLAKILSSLERIDFDAIHEASYSVEAALARIGKEPGFDGVNSIVAPRCEIVHLASELHDAETLKAAVPSLVRAVNEQLPAR